MPDIVIEEKFSMTIQQVEHEDHPLFPGQNAELRMHALHDGLLEFVGRMCGKYTCTEAECELLQHSLAAWFTDLFERKAQQHARD